MARYGDLIEEAKQYLKTQPQWSLKFSHREGNRAAHVLAKFGLSLVAKNVWIKEVLNFLLYIAIEELSQ